MADKKGVGRPAREGGAIKPYAVRIEDEIINRLDEIVDIERAKTGFKIERSDLVRKALTEFIQKYDND
jgi:metal-responsive CopG/Arc/MetJ family transcriptional regulator